MPTPTRPTHVLTTSAVRWSIETLGVRRIDPAFIYYLYLRQQWIQGRLAEASPSSAEVRDLIRMPGGPPGKPYYRPLRERGARTGALLRTFWLHDNLAGSWSPASLARLSRAGWLVDTSGNYMLPPDHASKAKDLLLFGQQVPVRAVGGFFMRNDGFVFQQAPVPDDLIEAFRQKFGYGPDDDAEFRQVFDTSIPDLDLTWFEPVEPQEEPHA